MPTIRSISAGLALALALAAGAAPVSAKPFDINAHGSFVPSGSASGQALNQAEMNAYVHATSTGIPSTVVHVASTDGGFDWGDAGVGAAGALALSMLGLGGTLAVSSQRRKHQPTRPSAPTA